MSISPAKKTPPRRLTAGASDRRAAGHASRSAAGPRATDPKDPNDPGGGDGGDDGDGDEPGGLRKLLVAAARTLVPLIEGYGRSTPDGVIEDGEPGELSDAERLAYKTATAKLVVEAGEILLANNPVTPEGVPLVRGDKDPETGRYAPPTLAFAVAAAKAWAARSAQATAMGSISAAPPAQTFAAQAAPVPVPVNELRILAMSNRATRSSAYSAQSIARGRTYERTGAYTTSAGVTRATPVSRSLTTTRGGCGDCGGQARSGCRCSETAATAAAGEDQGWFAVTPATRARLKACFADVVCDLLRCIDQTFCADGRFDFDEFADNGDKLKECLGVAACSLLHCVPEALCPPPADELCSPDPRPALPCNFAVEDDR